jgi:predicted DCC family thiol-disulfide oxidoreductase YuxK
VLLYDGECGLCNRVVRLLLRLDRAGTLAFAPLQGPAASAFLKAHGLPTHDYSTLVFVPDWSHREDPGFQQRSRGVIAALRVTGGRGRALAAFLAVVPGPIRDAGYSLVARTRYRLFGRWGECPLPRPEWKARFLDE